MKVSSQSDDACNKMEKSKWIKFWFVSSEFKWLWLVAGNRYLQCDELGEVSVLDEVGRLNVTGWCWGDCIKCLKRE